MNFRLVPMDKSHLQAIADIERACFSAPWSASMLEEELYNDTASYIVAEGEDGTVLGYAGLRAVLDEGYIDNVAVAKAFRRLGVADALISAFCRFGRAKLAFLTLEVRASNEGAIALYIKHGFTEAGRRKAYYQNPVEDAILMTLEFPREGSEDPE
ncbi:Ribosomal-protein-alanine acetyltransferase [bioreactor metagenome]|uniref:Ribosomal-protein-alanine acetyltransferase n=1 Tax=bioreactor metagenome TaxID=1076179 RepID=A0A644WFN0_9ZZZZ